MTFKIHRTGRKKYSNQKWISRLSLFWYNRV